MSEFYLADGRDFDSIFSDGNAGIDVQKYNSAGQNLGNIYMSGNVGITTHHQRSDGTDCGNLFGKILYNQKLTLNSDYTFSKEVTVTAITGINSSRSAVITLYDSSKKILAHGSLYENKLTFFDKISPPISNVFSIYVSSGTFYITYNIQF